MSMILREYQTRAISCPPQRQRPRTPEEELREMREILLRVSPLALREVDKEMGR